MFYFALIQGSPMWVCWPDTCYVDQAGIELAVILLLLLSQCWAYKHVLFHHTCLNSCSIVLWRDESQENKACVFVEEQCFGILLIPGG